MSQKKHWEAAYQGNDPTDVSWYQVRPHTSLELIAATQAPCDGGIIDVGGGASTLVDCLLEDGYTNLAVLDVSGSALAHARERLGQRAAGVQWIEADVTAFRAPTRFAVWHDRAVFHFLTTAEDRQKYMAALWSALIPRGHVIIATFANDGPEKCSGLEVARYDEAKLAAELGPDFELCEARRETHRTPWDSEQRFIYCRFRASENMVNSSAR